MKLTNGDDIPIFRIMPIFLLDVLALLASNADEKRLFSEAELIKTKLRSTMTPFTQAALLYLSEHIRASAGNVAFEPTAEMIDPTQKPVLE